MVIEIFIEGSKLDLYETESISITQGVQDVKDISKLFADFSQSFNVPASRNNNRIFKHYYNQDIDNGFDARTRKNAIININTIPFKTGKIQLNGVDIKHNEPSSYKITFFGDVLKVKDLIGDDKLNTLDWLSNFDHDFSASNVLTGLTSGLDFTVDGVDYDRAVVYPLISYNRQFFYNSDPSNTTANDELLNINYNASRTKGIAFNELKPAIKLSVIIDAIQQKYGFSFIGDFFESERFKQIYVNLNKSVDLVANGKLLFEDAIISQSSFTWELFTNGLYRVVITPNTGFNNTPYKVQLTFQNDVVYFSNNYLYGQQVVEGYVNNIPPNEDLNITARVFSVQDFEFSANTEFFVITPNPFTVTSVYTNSYTNQVIDFETVITDYIQDIKTYDFLIGMFKTFNLVTIPSDGNILVEDLQTWYTKGDIIDITPYVDTESKKVDKGKIYNKIDFRFQESEQILADEFRLTNNRGYGDEELTLYTDATETEKLDGETLEIESVFENPIFERLFDLNDNTQTVIQYCPYFDRQINTISGSPFMFYAPSVDVLGNTIGYGGGGFGSYQEIDTTVIMPSHAFEIDNYSFSLNFSAEINEYTSGVYYDNIYSRYYADYIGDVFSVKRRNYNYKAILPLRILNVLKLNDRLIIGNTRYLINKITSNLTKREDTLELINDIYDAPLATDVLNNSLFRPSFARYGSNTVTDSVQYIGVSGKVPKIENLGFGTAWLTIDSYGSGSVYTIKYTLDANYTGAAREIGINVTDDINNPTFIIQQSDGAGSALNFSNLDNSALMNTILIGKP